MSNISKNDWSTTLESKKAWMSVRDADHFEQLILRLAELKNGEKLKIIEWGGGRSTCWFTHVLEYMKIPYSWLMLEHNREFFDQDIRPIISLRKGSMNFYNEDIPKNFADLYNSANGPISVIFDYGNVSPFDTGIYAHRLVNMDRYVNLPSDYNFECDIVIVDGRKRRRCLLEGKKLIGQKGFVLLHDAWRKHYQCAWPEFIAYRRFGDECWIGCNHTNNFENLLPWYAFERHAVQD